VADEGSGTRSKHRPLASRLRLKDSRAVLRGADGKGRSRLPVTAVALRAHETRHKPYLASRLPYACTVRREGGLKPISSPYPYPVAFIRGSILRESKDGSFRSDPCESVSICGSISSRASGTQWLACLIRIGNGPGAPNTSP